MRISDFKAYLMRLPYFVDEEPEPLVFSQAVIDRGLKEGVLVQREDGQVYYGCRKVIPNQRLPT